MATLASITYQPLTPTNTTALNSDAVLELQPVSSTPITTPNTPTTVETQPPLDESVDVVSNLDVASNVVENQPYWQGLLDNDFLLPLLGQLTLGGILGLATGYAIKKALKFVLLTVGILFILLQVGVYFEVVHIDWLRIQEMVNPFLEQDSLKRNWQSFLHLLTANIPFAGGFIPMLFVGLRMK